MELRSEEEDSRREREGEGGVYEGEEGENKGRRKNRGDSAAEVAGGPPWEGWLVCRRRRGTTPPASIDQAESDWSGRRGRPWACAGQRWARMRRHPHARSYVATACLGHSPRGPRPLPTPPTPSCRRPPRPCSPSSGPQTAASGFSLCSAVCPPAAARASCQTLSFIIPYPSICLPGPAEFDCLRSSTANLELEAAGRAHCTGPPELTAGHYSSRTSPVPALACPASSAVHAPAATDLLPMTAPLSTCFALRPASLHDQHPSS